MCCPDVFPTSTFLLGLVCLTAFSNFAKTSADFSGREKRRSFRVLLVHGGSDSSAQEQIRERGCEQIWDSYMESNFNL